MSKKPEPEQPAQPEPKFLRSNRFRGGYEMKEFKPRLDRSALTRRIVVIGSIVTLGLTVLLVAAAAIQLLLSNPIGPSPRSVPTPSAPTISAQDKAGVLEHNLQSQPARGADQPAPVERRRGFAIPRPDLPAAVRAVGRSDRCRPDRQQRDEQPDRRQGHPPGGCPARP